MCNFGQFWNLQSISKQSLIFKHVRRNSPILTFQMSEINLTELEDVNSKIKQMKAEKLEHNSENGPFYHECPFIKDDKCSLYDFRSLICRAHGLAYFSKSGKVLVPACVNKGLNYSQVYDFDTKQISKEKYEKLGVVQEPLAHNVGLYFLTSNSLTEELGLDFGEIKPMLDWFN